MKDFFVTAGAVACGTIIGFIFQVFLPQWLTLSFAGAWVVWFLLDTLNTAWRKRLELQKKP